jgi:N-acetylmuramoyl-L-alanine amidase
MPSALIELGYISNRAEEKYLNSAHGQNVLVNAIYKAFTEYKKEYDKRNKYTLLGNPSSPSSSNIDVYATDEYASEIEYKIQFLTSSKLYNAHANVFKGLNPVEYYKDGSIYKYTHGSSMSENEILSLLRKVKTKFKDAFVVEFKDGIRIK